MSAAALGEGISVSFDGEDVEDFELTQAVSEDLAVSIAFDVSGSMQGEPLQVAKQSAIGLVNDLPANTPISLTSFGDESVLVQETTTDRDVIVNAINSLQALSLIHI